MTVIFLLVVLGTLKALAVPADAREIKGRARVIDGDTLYVGQVKKRLNGIDAPERGQRPIGPQRKPSGHSSLARSSFAS